MRNRKFISLFLSLVLVFPLLNLTVRAEDVNLAQNKSYKIEYESPIENSYPNLVHNDPSGALTDGNKAAEPKANDPAWLILYRGTAITVTIDLGEVCSVKRFSFGQLHSKGAGIYCSRYVYVLVSEDGNKYATVGEHIDENSITSAVASRVGNNITFDKYYKARYVKVVFSSDVFVYADEIEVFGSRDQSLGESAQPDAEREFVNAYPTDIDGLRNIVLMYCGKYYNGAESNIGQSTEANLLPYFAYVDKNQKPLDTMFDGMLFLPLNPAPSGSKGTEDCSFGKMTGWQAYLESTIGKGSKNVNIAALNDVVGKYKQQLGLAADYKYPVYIAVPYIHLSDSVVFGSLDGEMIVPSTLENRVKIVKWFIDLILSSFETAGFEHVKLNGFYWHDELVQYSKSDTEDELIKAFNEYVHTKGYKSTWIPYYCAPGYETWKELGFDAAVLQNGYPFVEYANKETGEKKEGTINDALTQAKKYGMGIEIELSGLLKDGNTEALSRYYKLLNAAKDNNIMENGLCMYYQGGGPGTLYNCSVSLNADARSVYDMTYKYIHKKFSSSAPTIEPNQIIILKKGSRTSGNIAVYDEDTEKNLLKPINVTQAKNLKMTLQNGGFIILNSDSDFTGEDSFSFQISDGISTTEQTTVKIYVVENCALISAINGELKDNTINIFNEAGKTTGTDDSAYEVVVGSDGKIKAVGGNNNTIPGGGYVISGRGEAKSYLIDFAKAGRTVLFDKITKTVYIDGDKIERSQAEQPTETHGYITWIIIGALVLILISTGAYIIINKKPKKESFDQ
jgi:hypothetical protein